LLISNTGELGRSSKRTRPIKERENEENRTLERKSAIRRWDFQRREKKDKNITSKKIND